MADLYEDTLRYDKARQLKEAQDDYCSAALSGKWNGLDKFPEDIQWEAMVAILRGQVKVSFAFTLLTNDLSCLHHRVCPRTSIESFYLI